MPNICAPLFAAGVIWLSENNVVPVMLVDSSDNMVTGIPASGVTVSYNRQGDSSNQAFSPSGSQWVEKGLGLYALTFPNTIINQEGLFEYAVQQIASGKKDFRGAAKIEQRPEARVWNASASGYNTVGTMGNLENTAGNSIEVYGSASYDAAGQTLTFDVWAELNGALITAPTSCRVTVKDDLDATVCDITNASPNADGTFRVQATTVTLTVKKTYKVRVRVTYNGVEYSSGEGLQCFS